jgi:hypothetical protein
MYRKAEPYHSIRSAKDCVPQCHQQNHRWYIMPSDCDQDHGNVLAAYDDSDMASSCPSHNFHLNQDENDAGVALSRMLTTKVGI